MPDQEDQSSILVLANPNLRTLFVDETSRQYVDPTSHFLVELSEEEAARVSEYGVRLVNGTGMQVRLHARGRHLAYVVPHEVDDRLVPFQGTLTIYLSRWQFRDDKGVIAFLTNAEPATPISL